MNVESVDDVERKTGLQQESCSVDAGMCPYQRKSPQKSKHFLEATGLIVTYLIEVGIQISLIVLCWRSFVPTEATSEWSWQWILSGSTIVTSLFVTTCSIVWVWRGLDFVGRFCARLLCYVMHCLLLGLMWRYLKLSFAYDKADVQEFVALRSLQTYIQSLPLTAIHLAWLITFRENWTSFYVWIVIAEVLSVTLALLIVSCVQKADTSDKKVLVKAFWETECPQCLSSSEDAHLWHQIVRTELSVLSRALLLCSRLIVIGMVIVHLKYWTILMVVGHLIFTFVWIRFAEERIECTKRQCDIENGEMNVAKVIGAVANDHEFVTHVAKCTFVLFWDVNSTLLVHINLCAWILPAAVGLVENVAMIMFHWYHHGELVVTITSGACLCLGWLLFSSLNFTNCDMTKACFAQLNRQTKESTLAPPDYSLPVVVTFPVIAPSEKMELSQCQKVNRRNSPDSLHGSTSCTDEKVISQMELLMTPQAKGLRGRPFIVANNYTNISEVLMTRVKADVVNDEKRRKYVMDSASNDRTVLGRRSSLPTTLEETVPNHLQNTTCPTTWVPDTCCNDSNGSSNSRNTNTLLDPGSIPVENDGDTEPGIDYSNLIFYYSGRDNSVTLPGKSWTPGELNKLRPRCSSAGLPQSVSRSGSDQKRHRDSKARDLHPRTRISPASSLTSLSSLRRIRTSTPVEIKRASRVIVNYPKHHKIADSKTVSRCLCQADRDPESNGLYEKLMEDTYGILICEGDTSQEKRLCQLKLRGAKQPATVLPSIFHASKKLKILCAKCLQNHDPLLSNCVAEDPFPVHLHQTQSSPGAQEPVIPSYVTVIPDTTLLPSETTDYPSETEMTCTMHDGDDQASVSSHVSTTTYTTWPHAMNAAPPSMWTTSLSHLSAQNQSCLPKEFTSLEYVRTWLLTSQARLRHQQKQQQQLLVLQQQQQQQQQQLYETNPTEKKVSRSKTMVQSSRCRSGQGVKSNENGSGRRSHQAQARSLGRRQGPVGRGQSPLLSQELHSVTNLSFQPPPKQKQHPVLPHSLILAHQGESLALSAPLNTLSQTDQPDAFYKDVEIVV